MADIETPAVETPAVTPPVTPASSERTVPFPRFQAVTAEKRALEGEVAALKAKVGELDPVAKSAATLTTQIGALQEELGLVRAGLTDPEGADVARVLYGRLPAEGKPATIGDYVAGIRAIAEGRGPEGATVPKPLAAYFTPATQGAPPPKAPPLPKAPGSNDAPPSAAAPISAEAIKSLREEAVRTGDWTKVQANMAAIDAALVRKK